MPSTTPGHPRICASATAAAVPTRPMLDSILSNAATEPSIAERIASEPNRMFVSAWNCSGLIRFLASSSCRNISRNPTNWPEPASYRDMPSACIACWAGSPCLVIDWRVVLSRVPASEPLTPALASMPSAATVPSMSSPNPLAIPPTCCSASPRSGMPADEAFAALASTSATRPASCADIPNALMALAWISAAWAASIWAAVASCIVPRAEAMA